MAKFVTVDHLKKVAESIVKYVNSGKLSAVNICPQCGAVVTSEDMTCEYCGAKLKLVVSRDNGLKEVST